MKPHPPPPAPLHEGATRGLPWPLPALVVWVLAWSVCEAARAAGAADVPGWLVGVACGVVLARASGLSRWRAAIAAVGFPLSSIALGFALPAWSWAAAAGLLLLAYPVSAWRDAPFFPTPARALRALPELIKLPGGARVLDAGCGLGHGLHALHEAYPQARLEGVERSALLAWLCRRRVAAARIVHGDMWQQPWHGVDLVYVFQRPESMARAWDKARREMPAGAWFVSLEFEVPRAFPHSRWREGPDAKPLWVYRVGVAQRPRQRDHREAALALVPEAMPGDAPSMAAANSR